MAFPMMISSLLVERVAGVTRCQQGHPGVADRLCSGGKDCPLFLEKYCHPGIVVAGILLESLGQKTTRKFYKILLP